MKKWLGWLKESNRPAHMKAGALVYVVMLVVCLLLGVSVSSSMILAFVATVIVAATVIIQGVATSVFIVIASLLN